LVVIAGNTPATISSKAVGVPIDGILRNAGSHCLHCQISVKPMDKNRQTSGTFGHPC
jgi:hypothetical protein